jgi:hypothetical protein
MNEYGQSNQREERTTTADLAGVTTEQPRGTDGQNMPVDANGNGNMNGNGNGSGAYGTNGVNGHAVTTAGPESTGAEDSDHTPLLQQSDADTMHNRWVDIQANFVDDPRRAVEDADALVA